MTIRSKLFSVANDVDDYCAKESVAMFDRDYSYFALQKLKLLLRVQIFVQKLFPEIKDKYDSYDSCEYDLCDFSEKE